MAEEWGTIPAYIESANACWARAASSELLSDFDEQRDGMLEHARSDLRGLG